jgi:hypothetical protein
MARWSLVGCYSRVSEQVWGRVGARFCMRLPSVGVERYALCRPSGRRGADQEISGRLHEGLETVRFGASDPIRDPGGL